MIKWIKKSDALITSLVYWDKHYEPFQVIIFRWDRGDSQDLIYYFNINSVVYAFPHIIEAYRTHKEEEKQYHIARLGLMLLEKTIEKTTDHEDMKNYYPPKNDELDKLLRNAFMSIYAMELMREKNPEFGYYSLSPNFKKIENMLAGIYENLLTTIKKIMNL
jgi:hypothetical protein